MVFDVLDLIKPVPGVYSEKFRPDPYTGRQHHSVCKPGDFFQVFKGGQGIVKPEINENQVGDFLRGKGFYGIQNRFKAFMRNGRNTDPYFFKPFYLCLFDKGLKSSPCSLGFLKYRVSKNFL